MKIHKRIAISGVLLMASLIISQCTLPTRGDSTDFRAYLNQPPDGAVFGVGERVAVQGRMVDSLGIDTRRVVRVTFFANGLGIGAASLTLNPRFYFDFAETEWIPLSAGEYFLQVIGSRGGNLAISDANKVCVIDFSLASPDLGDIGGYLGVIGYEGECEIPERSPDARPGEITFSTFASPGSLTYYPGTWYSDISEYRRLDNLEPPEGCGGLSEDILITFESLVGDPNDDIVFVKVDVSYVYNSNILSSSQILNRVSSSALDAKVFTGISQARRVFIADRINQTFEVIWTAYAIGRSGEILASEGPNTIPVVPCYLIPLESLVPLLEEVPADQPEFTPSELTCPPGTYYAPATNRCIAIRIPEKSSGESSGSGESGGVCNLSVSICNNEGKSFNSKECECVTIQ